MAHNLQELADMAGKFGFLLLDETGNSSEAMVVLNIIKENLHTARTMEAVKKEFGLVSVKNPIDKEVEDIIKQFDVEAKKTEKIYDAMVERELNWYEKDAEKRASASVNGQTKISDFNGDKK